MTQDLGAPASPSGSSLQPSVSTAIPSARDDDRALLERAALAAGLPMHRYCESWNAMARYTMSDGYHGPSWNPLKDDGDALRLAVKLNMRVRIQKWGVSIADSSTSRGQRAERHEDDPYAATRRAIVRAAAAIDRGIDGDEAVPTVTRPCEVTRPRE